MPETDTEAGVEPGVIALMADTDVRRFVRQSIRSGKLSKTIERLNSDLIDGDASSAMLARKALSRMGFL